MMNSVQRLKVWQRFIFVFVWFAYGSTYLLRKPIGVVKDNLQNALEIDTVGLGWMDMAFLLPYAVVSLMLGSVGDYLGPRVILGFGLIFASLATASISFCASYLGLLALLGISGASQALCWPASCTILSRWFSDTARNTVFGMFGTCCFVFGMSGTTLAVYLQESYGWRHTFLSPSIFVAMLGILVLQVCHDPEKKGLIISGRSDPPAKMKGEASISFLRIWQLPLVPEVSLTMFCIKSVRYALMFWLPLYLLRSLNYSQETAGLASMSFEVGGTVGSVFFGMAVDRWMDGNAILASTFAISGSALSLLAFIVLAPWGSTYHVIFLALAGALNCGPDILLASSVAADIGKQIDGATAVTGVINGMGSLGTVVEGPLVGLVATNLGWHAVIPLMIILSGLGCLAGFRAHIIHVHSSRKNMLGDPA